MLIVLNNLVATKRNMANMSILNNPETITINRKIITLNTATGGKNIVQDNFNITCRITKINNSDFTGNENIGLQSIYNGAVVLADYTAPFLQDMNKYNYSFEYDNQNYNVKSVMINLEKDNITSIQLICEVV